MCEVRRFREERGGEEESKEGLREGVEDKVGVRLHKVGKEGTQDGVGSKMPVGHQERGKEGATKRTENQEGVG